MNYQVYSFALNSGEKSFFLIAEISQLKVVCFYSIFQAILGLYTALAPTFSAPQHFSPQYLGHMTKLQYLGLMQYITIFGPYVVYYNIWALCSILQNFGLHARQIIYHHKIHILFRENQNTFMNNLYVSFFNFKSKKRDFQNSIHESIS